MEITIGQLLICAAIVACMYFYGEMKYSEGHKKGKFVGVVNGAVQMLDLFENKKIVETDSETGALYRLNDLGERDYALITPGEIAATRDKLKKREDGQDGNAADC